MRRSGCSRPASGPPRSLPLSSQPSFLPDPGDVAYDVVQFHSGPTSDVLGPAAAGGEQPVDDVPVPGERELVPPVAALALLEPTVPVGRRPKQLRLTVLVGGDLQ